MAGSQRMSRSSVTAALHRFVQLNDRMNTHVLTFIVPSQLYRGFIPEVYSKDFLYGHQQWCLRFVHANRHIGAYLVLRSALSGMVVRVDFNIVAVNRDHFTRNENYGQKAVEFSTVGASHGCGVFIELSDLQNRNFLFDDHKFLIELELRNAITLFSESIALNREIVSHGRFETTYFTFGCCDWNLLVLFEPESSSSDANGSETGRHISITLNRHTRLDHRCRIRYRVQFRCDDTVVDSGVIDQNLDVRGYGREQHISAEAVYRALNHKGSLEIIIELYTMHSQTIVELYPTSRSKNVVRLYDSEQQEWVAETDILGKVVNLKLFYADINNVPRGFSRLVCFNTSLVPHDFSKPLVRALTSPYCLYYSQREADEGHEIAFNLPVEEVCDSSSGYVDPETGVLSIQFEWIYSHLLYRDHYHHYDNIGPLHKHQMSREILALQSENYALEKQVHSYQQSIAKKECGSFVGDNEHDITSRFSSENSIKTSTASRTGTAIPEDSNGQRGYPNHNQTDSRRGMHVNPNSTGNQRSHHGMRGSTEGTMIDDQRQKKTASVW